MALIMMRIFFGLNDFYVTQGVVVGLYKAFSLYLRVAQGVAIGLGYIWLSANFYSFRGFRDYIFLEKYHQHFDILKKLDSFQKSTNLENDKIVHLLKPHFRGHKFV